MHKFIRLDSDPSDQDKDLLYNKAGVLYFGGLPLPFAAVLLNPNEYVITDADGNLSTTAVIPGGATNLGIANITGTTLDVTSDTGSDATIPAATPTDAGLLTASDKVKLNNTSGVNTGDQDLSGLQPLDSDLSDIAGLSPSNNDFLQYKSGHWINRTPAQSKNDLTLVKGDVGLGNVDNTSDVNKPVSTAQAAADAAVLASAEAYTDAAVTGLYDDRGNFDASGGAYPSSGGSGAAGAIVKGDVWMISVAGTLPSGRITSVGDTIRALIDTPGNTQANWAWVEHGFGYTAENSSNKDNDGTLAANSSTRYPSQSAVVTYVAAQISAGAVPDASETVKGKAELATEAETNAGVDDLRIVTPFKLLKWWENIRLLASTITASWTFLAELVLSDISEPGVTTNKLYSVAGALKWAGKYLVKSNTDITATTVGVNVITAANPSAITFVRINADNSVSLLSAAAFLTAIGAQASGTYLVASNNLSDVVNAATALTNLGATTVGKNMFALANPSAVTFLRINADNTITTRTASQMITDLGGFGTTAGTFCQGNDSRVTGALQAASNLSDVANALTARVNLKTYDACVSTAASDFTAPTGAGTHRTITGMSLVTAANETWSFEVHIVGQCSTASGARFKVNYTNAPTTSSVAGFGSNTSNAVSLYSASNATTPVESGTAWGIATTEMGFKITGCFTNGASANTVTISVSPVGSGETVTIRANSYITARRIS